MPPRPSTAVVNTMQPSSSIGAPVDWSEFHIWNFGLQDVAKLNQKVGWFGSSGDTANTENAKINLKNPDVDLMNKDTKESGMNSLAALSSSVVAQSSQMKQGVQQSIKQRWNAWHNMTKASPASGAGHYHKGAVYTAYAQFASGAIGGCTATYTTHWLDTVKVKMQTLPQVYSTTGPVTCLRETITHEGVKGLYKGAVPAVLGQTAKTAVVFMSYGLCEELVCQATGLTQVSDLTVWHHASAGALTGVMASFVLCPLELVKCRLQALHQVSLHVDSKKLPRQKMGFQKLAGSAPYTMVREILRLEGVKGLYRGLPGIWVKDVPGSFIYFGSYEAARALVRQAAGNQQMHLNSRTVFVCGMFAGLCFCITHPIESVKTRVQVMSAVSETRGFLSAMVHILKTEGLKPLCSGLKPCVLRACLYSGIQFVTYEACRDVLLPDHF